MKIKTNFTTILFYFISAVSIFIWAMVVSNATISLLMLIIFSMSLYIGSFYLQSENKTYSAKIMKISFIILFITYSIYVSSLLFSNIYFGRDEILNVGINLIPFKTIFLFLTSASEHTLPNSDILINLLGNLITFIPLSFYLPLFFKKAKKFSFCILIVTLIIIFIEIMQLLLKCGACDIGDLILNVLGASIFYPVFNNKKTKKIVERITMF